MNTFTAGAAHILLIGIGATAVMDAWLLLLQRLGVPTLNFAMIGRWVGHWRNGTWKHDAIAKAAPAVVEFIDAIHPQPHCNAFDVDQHLPFLGDDAESRAACSFQRQPFEHQADQPLALQGDQARRQGFLKAVVEFRQRRVDRRRHRRIPFDGGHRLEVG